MQHNNYMKGILAGMVVGAVAGMILDPLRSEKENAHPVYRHGKRGRGGNRLSG